MNHSRSYSGVRDVRVWHDTAAPDAPAFSAPTHVDWVKGRFVNAAIAEGTARAADPAYLDGTGLWLIPGLVDAHLHAGWQAFDASDRECMSEPRTTELIEQGLQRTLAAGFTSARDAGGLLPSQATRLAAHTRPRLQLAARLIDRAAADAAGGIEHAVAGVLEQGAKWVKLVATAGVATAAGAGLEPHLTATEVRRAALLAADAGAGVMVHAWGGPAIDFAIAAGELAPVSLEHGIFLTPDQAKRAAEASLTFVPTLRIYTLVQAMISAGELPASLDARVREAVNAHPHAVRVARDAGLALALGSDYGTPSQHGTGRLELAALVAAGLTATEALVAATRGGAALMARVDPDQNQAIAGRIAPGAPADAVLLTRDPREPGAMSDPGAVAAVILAGRVVAPASFERNPS